MDRSRDYHIKGSKSDREGQVLYCVTYMWNLKNETNELIYKTNRLRKQTDGYQRGKVGGGIN